MILVSDLETDYITSVLVLETGKINMADTTKPDIHWQQPETRQETERYVAEEQFSLHDPDSPEASNGSISRVDERTTQDQDLGDERIMDETDCERPLLCDSPVFVLENVWFLKVACALHENQLKKVQFHQHKHLLIARKA